VPWTRSWWSLGSGPGEETSPELFSVSALERRQVLVLVSNMLWEAVKVLVLVRLLEFQVPAMYASLSSIFFSPKLETLAAPPHNVL